MGTRPAPRTASTGSDCATNRSDLNTRRDTG
jgi:hypothetical protein